MGETFTWIALIVLGIVDILNVEGWTLTSGRSLGSDSGRRERRIVATMDDVEEANSNHFFRIVEPGYNRGRTNAFSV